MSAVSGIISRQVLPICGNLCFFCPGLRTRSRQPVKRYKSLISDIFPKNQEVGPNDRKIGKLCEYAAKNPLRIPKITTSLEQRCYKELRNENFHCTKIVMCIYRKLMITCKEQMPLFSSSLLSIIHTLLDQTRFNELQVTGCETLFDFVNNQTDGTCMFNLEGFIPKLYQLAQEVGEEKRARQLRSAALQALSSMIWFMGEHCHISVEFDNIVSVVLENYGGPESTEDSQNVQKDKGEILTRVSSWRTIVNEKGEVNVTAEDALNPCFWSRVCLYNMAKLGKEATTMRRVLESLFCYFDNGDLWSPKHGLAFPVLRDMQFLMDNSGQSTHVLLSILIKHLDHKNVLKQPSMQLSIIEVTTSLAQNAKVESSVAIISAVSDVMRHLRKSLHNSLNDGTMADDVKKWNRNFREAVDKCLVELSDKVGDAGPVLDIMASMLENISTITVIARTTTSAVYRTAQIVASIPNLSYLNKTFPEALLHHLLPAMVHPDHETRVNAHCIFSVVLVPSSVAPQRSLSVPKTKNGANVPRTLSRTVSVFSSSAALFEKLKKEKNSSSDSVHHEIKPTVILEEKQTSNWVLTGSKSSYGQAYSIKNAPALSAVDENNSNKETNAGILKLSSHQIRLLLSSIWAQSISPANTPENYEAIAHTYSLVLLFSQGKNSSHESLIRSFQLAFSLRNMAVKVGHLPPSRRRSLFTLATSMILFSSKAQNIIEVICSAKLMLTENMVPKRADLSKFKEADPFLHLIEDCKLQAVSSGSNHTYGSVEDDNSASNFLSKIDITGEQSREFFVAKILKSLGNLSDSELAIAKEQLLSDFLPDDVHSLRGQLFSTANQANKAHSKDSSLSESAPTLTEDDDTFIDSFEGQLKHKEPSLQNLSLMSVNHLLESVLETAAQVGRISVTGPDVSYKEMALHCEMQQKISHLISNQMRKESSINLSLLNHSDEGNKVGGNLLLNQNFTPNTQGPPFSTVPMQCGTEYQHHLNFFMLPASSPYDNFLKAAGC